MAELLAHRRLSAGYGEAVVLNDVSLALAEGAALALLGRNGMGKTTLINTIVGVTRYCRRQHRARRPRYHALRPDQRAHAGVGWVPQERNIFRSLTVQENLTAVARPGPLDPGEGLRACFRGSRSGGKTSATSCPAASSRCSRSAARWCSIRACCCSTSRSRGWRRLSSRNCWRRCGGSSATKACPPSWSSRMPKILGVTDQAIISSAAPSCMPAESAALLDDRAALETYLGVTDAGPRRMGRAKR